VKPWSADATARSIALAGIAYGLIVFAASFCLGALRTLAVTSSAKRIALPRLALGVGPALHKNVTRSTRANSNKYTFMQARAKQKTSLNQEQ
jgi:hypothetical protein